MKKGPFITALLAIALSGVAWLYERQLSAKARSTLSIQQVMAANLRQQLASLERQHAEAAREAAALAQELERETASTPTSLSPSTELRILAEDRVAQARRLRAMFEQHPDQKIPEMQLLADIHWLELAQQVRPGHSERMSRAAVRDRAIRIFFVHLREALTAYNAVPGRASLGDVTQLAPFFKRAIDPTILARYEIIPDSAFLRNSGRKVIVERSPIDEDYDSRQTASTDGKSSGGGVWIGYRLQSAVNDGITAYAAANNGRISTKASDLLPLVQNPFGRAYLEAIAAYENDHNGQSSYDPSVLLPYATHPEVRSLLERTARVGAERSAP
jgi:hypothetical protein